MADKTGISWTDATWNPIVGCSVVSPGCTNCYAMRDAARIVRCSEGAGRASHYEGTIQPSKAGPVWTGKVALAPDRIVTTPLSWRRPRRIFVNSMGDLFHESVPDEWIDRVFAVMALAPQHTFQVLTKRSARMREYLSGEALRRVAQSANRIRPVAGMIAWPLTNVWLGVTAEDQTRADERIPDLLATPAAVRFVSCEPMLGPVDLTRVGSLESLSNAYPNLVSKEQRGRPETGNGSLSGMQIDAVNSTASSIVFFQTPDHMGGFTVTSPSLWPTINWVICGGESGPNARPMHPDWARGLRDQCEAAGVPFHFKQWGEWAPVDEPASEIQEDRELRGTGACFDGAHFHRVGKLRAGHLLDGVEHREFPEARNG